MTRIVALLSFYAERPADLERLVATLPAAHVDHLVALDGAYALFPDGQATSPSDNHAALEQACRTHGIGLTLHTPDTTWPGNETQKRTALFRAGEAHTSPTDWYLVVDGDESIDTAPADLKQQLAHSPLNVGEVLFREHKKNGKAKHFPIPILFRAERGIEVVGNHYTYRTQDGRHLWGNARNKRLEPRLPLHDLIVDHWTRQRDRGRRAQARAYYRARDRSNTEAGVCDRCDRPATRTLHTNWRPAHDGLVADWAEACSVHALEIEAENTHRLVELGHPDPQRVKIQYRLGPAPA